MRIRGKRKKRRAYKENEKEEESIEEAEHVVDEAVGCNMGVASWLVKEREIEIPNIEKSV